MKEPIRIAHIVGKWVGGGVESFTLNYFKNINKKIIQFDFICDSDSTNIPVEEIESLGGRVILIPPYQKVFKYQKELIRIFKENKYKIVHSHINTLSVFPLRAAKKAGVPIRIAHSHATTNKKETKRNFVKKLLKPLNKIYATNYACCSESAGRWMFGDKAFDDGKVKKINNAIEIDKFSYDKKIREEYRNSLGIQDNQIVIGHVGRMVETKNHSFILDVFSKICDKENAILLFVGQGPLEENLKKKAIQLGINDRVIFLGQREDVNCWYQAFDVFVLPSLYEGFGMALLEAQVSNLPCVASTEVPKESKIIDNFVFLSLKDSIEVWAKTIIELYKNSKRKSNNELISKNGYDITVEAKKLSDYYLKLIEENDHGKN